MELSNLSGQLHVQRTHHLHLLPEHWLVTHHQILGGHLTKNSAYILQSGVTYGHSESQGGSISTSIKNGIKLSLFKIFEYTLEVSVTTGTEKLVFKHHILA